MTDIKEFAQRIKAKRESKGMTQRELAAKVGITAASISAYEKQVKSPTLENALLVAKALDTTVDEMCGKCAAITLLDKFDGNEKEITEHVAKWVGLREMGKAGLIPNTFYEELVRLDWEGLNR